MASYGNAVPMAAPRPGHPATYGAPMQIAAPAAPAGTFSPGTKIQVGSHRVVIQKYLSEGGFAHVYLVKMPQPVDGTDQAVLKRVAVPDKETLRGMRTEVETMKRLKGHRPIVKYIDSHASELRGGGYEVFLLMEFCNGGGLIDFMNTRLQHRLTEPEILNIFTDIAEGVACMHYLKPPLLHRDLKVENVLITMNGSKRKFKLCDFGSSAAPKPAPQTVVECRLVDEDIQRHTTLQYRSPEMVDVYRKLPIDEKSDIWALGVLLYKLCYYTTPFEDQGQLAILNASYKFHSYPVFSSRLKQLIASMLRESPSSRPNIYQVLREGCAMQGLEVPLPDIYSNRSHVEASASRKEATPQNPSKTTPIVGAIYSPPPQQTQTIPDIVPMRRGRPAAANHQAKPSYTKPSPSPGRVTDGDPFAALDSKPKGDADELSSRFPTLDQFSLLHDQGSKFEFDSPTGPGEPNKDAPRAERGARDEFPQSQAQPIPVQAQAQVFENGPPKSGTLTEKQKPIPSPNPNSKPFSAPPRPTSGMSRASAIISSNPELQAIASPPPPQATQYSPPKSSMISIGTMTDSGNTAPREYPPVHRFPPANDYQSSTVPITEQRQSSQSQSHLQADQAQPPRSIPSVVPVDEISLPPRPRHVRHPSASGRSSLEASRPSSEQVPTMANRSRPTSTYLESNMDYLREREAAPRPLRSPALPAHGFSEQSATMKPQDESAIESNVEFLRSMEDSEIKRDKSGRHSKRSSLTSLSGTKNKLAGRFGDAFKKFEGPGSSGSRTPQKELDRSELTPIAGSEATDGRSDDGRFPEETEMSPEMRREMEAQSLAEEERRVEAAAAEYRQRVAAREAGDSAPLPRSIGGVSRAQSIQTRVQNLLDESQNTPVQRTASGYGKFSDAATASSGPSQTDKQLPDLPRKPIMPMKSMPLRQVATSSADMMASRDRPIAATPEPTSSGRPVPPPKPKTMPKPSHLNNMPPGGARNRSPPKPQKPSRQLSQESEQLVGIGLQGRPVLDMSPQDKEDYLQDFSKRFPSLSAIEMVETDINTGAVSSSVDKRGR